VNAKYEEVYFVWFIVKHKIVLALEPGAAGTWSATCDATQTQPVDIATALNSPGFDTSDYLKWRKGIQNPDTAGPGAFVKYHAFMADATESAEYVSNTVPSAIEAVNSGITTLMQRLDAAMAGLNTSVMMPGGEVMTFSGMDTDDEGRLYAHIKYAVAPDDVTPITS
jgi:hypothetical protein